MKVLNNGFFSLTLDSTELIKGLRQHDTQPRNGQGFEVMSGVKGKDGSLQRLLSADFPLFPYDALDLSNFPWPQVFRFEKHVVVCNQSSMYEYDATSGWINKLTGITTSSQPWHAASSYDWIYFTNGKVAVVRNPETHAYAVDSSAPVGLGVCNYNGQIIVGDQQV